MKSLYVAALMLMLSLVALAVPDSQQVGPYAVSFDLDADYQIQLAEPMETEAYTAYNLALFVDNSTGASIAIAEYKEPTDATLNVHKSMNAMSMMLQGFNATDLEDKVIDGQDGFLITAEPFEAVAGAPGKIYKAMYWLDSQDCECGPVSVGSTSVTITSTYPLDVTDGLLSSLKVVKGEAPESAVDGVAPAMPSMPSGGQVLPPE